MSFMSTFLQRVAFARFVQQVETGAHLKLKPVFHINLSIFDNLPDGFSFDK